MSKDIEQFVGLSDQSPIGGSLKDVGGIVEKGYRRENPHRRVDYEPQVQSSMRAIRAQHLREIVEDAGGPVRIGKVNRFKI